MWLDKGVIGTKAFAFSRDVKTRQPPQANLKCNFITRRKATPVRLTERDLKLLCWINAFGFVSIDHLKDFLGIAKPTAYGIEVELTKKSQARLKQIVKYYASNLDIQGVWYFCGTPEIKRLIEKAAGHLPHIQILNLQTMPKLTTKERESA